MNRQKCSRVHEKKNSLERTRKNLEPGMHPTVQIVQKIIPDPVEPWKKTLQDNYGVILLLTTSDINTWSVTVIARLTTVYGMFMAAVKIAVSGSEWIRAINIRNGLSPMPMRNGNLTINLDMQIHEKEHTIKLTYEDFSVQGNKVITVKLVHAGFLNVS